MFKSMKRLSAVLSVIALSWASAAHAGLTSGKISRVFADTGAVYFTVTGATYCGNTTNGRFLVPATETHRLSLLYAAFLANKPIDVNFTDTCSGPNTLMTVLWVNP